MARIKPAGGGGEIFSHENEPEQRPRPTLHNMVATSHMAVTEGYWALDTCLVQTEMHPKCKIHTEFQSKKNVKNLIILYDYILKG